MSVRNTKDVGLENKILEYKEPYNRQPAVVVESWTRNHNWLPLPELTALDSEVVGLHAIYPEGNFVALSATNDYTVDWGDGTVENYSSGVTAYHEFDYTNVNIANTNAPVTFQASANTVTRNNHGYANNDTVTFYNIVDTTGISEAATYYVVNATVNTFQVSETVNGSVIDLITDGSATLLPHKQAIVSITPQAANNLTSVNLSVKHNQANLANNYSTGWLDLLVAGKDFDSTGIQLSRFELVTYFEGEPYEFQQLEIFGNNYQLERFVARSLGNQTSMSYLFTYSTIQSVELDNIDYVTDMSYMFYYCKNLKTITLENTDSVTNMQGMFYNCLNLAAVFLPDVSNVTTMEELFSNCYELQSVNLGNTVSLTNMSEMFYYCKSLVEAPYFNTSNVTTMYYCFNNCERLVHVPLYDTKNVTDMERMFAYCYVLETVPLFDTRSVTTMENMFNHCDGLITVPSFNTENVTDIRYMFIACPLLEKVEFYDLSSVTQASSMFSICYNLRNVKLHKLNSITGEELTSLLLTIDDSEDTLETLELSILNNPNELTLAYAFDSFNKLKDVKLLFDNTLITSMSNMFSFCDSLKSVTLLGNGTNTVTDMSSMFSNCRMLTSVPLFNTSNVTDMYGMFTYCYSLSSVPLFDTSNVTNMSNMFSNCRMLTSVPSFDTSNVTDMNSMFNGCSLLSSVPLFNTSNVTDMSSIFEGCKALTSVPLFDTSNVTGMSNMFTDCDSLKTVPKFNTINVQAMSGMFVRCKSLISVPMFNTSNVASMSYMFEECDSITTIPIFDTTSLIDVNTMFQSCRKLSYFPSFDLSVITNVYGLIDMFNGCTNLVNVAATGISVPFSVENCKLSSTALDTLYTNLGTVISYTEIIVTGNYGVGNDDPTIATAKGWTVIG